MDKALLIIDVQNDFVSGSLGSEYAQNTVVPNVVKLIEEFPTKNIYATLDTHLWNYAETQEGKKLPVEHCIAGTWGNQLVDEIKDKIPEEHQIFKYTFGANPEELKRLLRDYSEIHVCGLCTDICVVSNALILKALFKEKKIIIHENACGGTTKENHDAAIVTMKCCQVDII